MKKHEKVDILFPNEFPVLKKEFKGLEKGKVYSVKDFMPHVDLECINKIDWNIFGEEKIDKEELIKRYNDTIDKEWEENPLKAAEFKEKFAVLFNKEWSTGGKGE